MARPPPGRAPAAVWKRGIWKRSEEMAITFSLNLKHKTSLTSTYSNVMKSKRLLLNSDATLTGFLGDTWTSCWTELTLKIIFFFFQCLEKMLLVHGHIKEWISQWQLHREHEFHFIVASPLFVNLDHFLPRCGIFQVPGWLGSERTSEGPLVQPPAPSIPGFWH